MCLSAVADGVRWSAQVAVVAVHCAFDFQLERGRFASHVFQCQFGVVAVVDWELARFGESECAVW